MYRTNRRWNIQSNVKWWATIVFITLKKLDTFLNLEKFYKFQNCLIETFVNLTLCQILTLSENKCKGLWIVFTFFSEDNTFNFLMKVNFFRIHFWNVGTSFSLNSILSKKFKSLIKANDNSWGAGMEKSRLKNSSFVWNIFIKRLNSLPLEEKTLTRPCPRKKSLADNQRLTKDFIKILWNEKK